MTGSALYETRALRQDATARLLLLLAKVSLNSAQQEQARALAVQIVDWTEFVQLAHRKFVSALVHRHLAACARDVAPEAALAHLGQLARLTTMGALRVAAAQTAFHKSCIESVGADHVYIKGVALAQRYYGGIGERPCRDIDILIAPPDFARVVEAAIAAGYRMVFDVEPRRFAQSDADRKFLTKHADVITLQGPDCVTIEAHRRLDKRGLNFDLNLAFATAQPISIAGVTMQSLATPYHFNYICYHHSRHFWSHLHWLADLDAMRRAPDCDPAQVLLLADAIGVRPTIDAALDLQALLAQPGLWGQRAPDTGGGRFLQACLYNLDGDLDVEKALRQGKVVQDFMSPWQASPGHIYGIALRSALERLRPKQSQYVAHPYPAPLHWVYSVRNAWKDIFTAISRLVSGGSAKRTRAEG